MKTSQELKEHYYNLYDITKTSGNPKFMQTFGEVMTQMYEWYVANKPEAAEEFLCQLESIKWNNYLTAKEADKIVATMTPKAPWTRDVWKQAMTSFGLPAEETPHYNAHALFVLMNAYAAKSATTIATLMGKAPGDVPPEAMVKATYALALDSLKDLDAKFNVRHLI